MAGRALRGMLSTADYKGGRALKSCHAEFIHIYGAAFIYTKGLLKSSPFFVIDYRAMYGNVAYLGDK